eukprot:226456-Rhodomonas_salina.2
MSKGRQRGGGGGGGRGRGGGGGGGGGGGRRQRGPCRRVQQRAPDPPATRTERWLSTAQCALSTAHCVLRA